MRKIGVVGLGYVGLPIAVSFGKFSRVVGFDINSRRVEELKNGHDLTREVSASELQEANIEFTTDGRWLTECDFIVVAVPTPIDTAKMPDLGPLKGASSTVGKFMRPGTIVVYESTVYPGTTEEVCIPILELNSGLKAGKDFFVGYSPERINPGDKEHTLETIVKVVSAQDEGTLAVIADTYGMVVEAGVYRAASIRVAEAAKVIENTQRDLNIALMNELAVLFDKLGIDTAKVLEAASTKWNFLKFTPGLVGGHCIGVDPYYLTYKAESVGYHPEVILAGRRINDQMGSFIATSLVKQMILRCIPVQGSSVAVLGFTFKEDVPDLRNSKVIDIIKELREYGIEVHATDPCAVPEEAFREYDVALTPLAKIGEHDAVVFAVAHREYRTAGWSLAKKLLKGGSGVVIDVKGILDDSSTPESITLWRL